MDLYLSLASCFEDQKDNTHDCKVNVDDASDSQDGLVQCKISKPSIIPNVVSIFSGSLPIFVGLQKLGCDRDHHRYFDPKHIKQTHHSSSWMGHSPETQSTLRFSISSLESPREIQPSTLQCLGCKVQKSDFGISGDGECYFCCKGVSCVCIYIHSTYIHIYIVHIYICIHSTYIYIYVHVQHIRIYLHIRIIYIHVYIYIVYT